jgi:RHS repeat-associated protein
MLMTSQLSENSHRGFDGLKAALYLGSTGVKSNTASGLPLRLRPTRIGSRSSGKERDAETGLDYFFARYYSPAQGRFISADWSSSPTPVPYAKFNDPQTLNLYAYVNNNPLATADLDGHGDWWSPSGVKIGTDNVNDGSVHVANPQNVSVTNGVVNPSRTTDIYNIPQLAGQAIWATYNRTLEKTTHPTNPDTDGNKHEDAFRMDSTPNGDVIIHEPSGPMITPNSSNLSVTQPVFTNTTIVGHSHAGGVNQGISAGLSLGGKTYAQIPAPDDLGKAGRVLQKSPNVIFLLIAVGNKNVLIYNAAKVTAKIPMEAFPK